MIYLYASSGKKLMKLGGSGRVVYIAACASRVHVRLVKLPAKHAQGIGAIRYGSRLSFTHICSYALAISNHRWIASINNQLLCVSRCIDKPRIIIYTARWSVIRATFLLYEWNFSHCEQEESWLIMAHARALRALFRFIPLIARERLWKITNTRPPLRNWDSMSVARARASACAVG